MSRRTCSHLFVVMATTTLLITSALGHAQTPYPVTTGKAYKFESVAAGV